MWRHKRASGTEWDGDEGNWGTGGWRIGGVPSMGGGGNYAIGISVIQQ